jgi:hypothetical protein
MKPKPITFLWVDMNGSTGALNILQWQTTRRTIREAFQDASEFLVARWKDKHRDPESYLFELEPRLVYAFKGLPELLDPEKPLRAPTKEEIKQLINP